MSRGNSFDTQHPLGLSNCSHEFVELPDILDVEGENILRLVSAVPVAVGGADIDVLFLKDAAEGVEDTGLVGGSREEGVAEISFDWIQLFDLLVTQ